MLSFASTSIAKKKEIIHLAPFNYPRLSLSNLWLIRPGFGQHHLKQSDQYYFSSSPIETARKLRGPETVIYLEATLKRLEKRIVTLHGNPAFPVSTVNDIHSITLPVVRDTNNFVFLPVRHL